MRVAVAIACVLCLSGSALGDVSATYVGMSSPAAVVPGATDTFTFLVENGSTDGESIADVQIVFPDGYILFPATMSYVPIVAARPSWDMTVPPVDHTALWVDNDGGDGEVYPTESVLVSIDVTVAEVLYGIPIHWCVMGDGTGAEPHQNCGCIELVVNPVEQTCWSSIKAFYLDSSQ